MAEYRKCNKKYILPNCFSSYNNKMTGEVIPNEDSYATSVFLSIIISVSIYQYYRKIWSKTRLQLIRKRSDSEVQTNKVIVALDLEHLFLEISTTYRDGYKKIETCQTGLKGLIQKTKEIFGSQLYYKLKMPGKIIRQLLALLTENPKIQLFLYTSLEMKTANKFLQLLLLENMFKMQNRRSCKDGFSEPLKHPIEVDTDIKRVIILTGNKRDHYEEDSKYFLVAKKNEIGETMKKLNRIVMKNENVDELHNELWELKMLVESDCENNN